MTTALHGQPTAASSNEENVPAGHPASRRRLLPHHLTRLEKVLPDYAIAARGAYSATSRSDLALLGASQDQLAIADQGPSLVYPIKYPSLVRTAEIFRPDVPRVARDRRGKESQPKWESPPKQHPVLDVSPMSRSWLKDTTKPVVVAESPLKGDVVWALFHAAGHPVLAIAPQGVWTWKAAALVKEWDCVTLKDREAYVLYDSDITSNADVLKAGLQLADFLRGRGAVSVKFVVLPPQADGSKQDVEDFAAAGGTYDTLMSFVADHPLPNGADVVWEAPGELEQVLPEPPAFPLDVLPAVDRELVQQHAVTRNTSVDLVALPLLVLPGAALQNLHAVEITPSFHVPTGIHAIVGADPNRGKNVIDELARPIRGWEFRGRKVAAEAQARAQARINLLDARLKKLEATVRESPDDAEAAAEYEEAYAERQRQNNALPRPRDVLVANTTIQAWARQLVSNDGCYAIIDSEGAGLPDLLAGRYSEGRPDVEILLRAHSGDPYKETKISRDTIDLRSIRGSACVAAQPVLVHEWFRDSYLDQRGVLNRFLFVTIPPRRVANLGVPSSAIPSHLQKAYERQVEALLSLCRTPPVDDQGEFVRRVLLFEFRSLQAFSEFGQSLEDRAAEFGDLHAHEGFLHRLLPDILARIAVALHALAWSAAAGCRDDSTPCPPLPLVVDHQHALDAIRVATWAIEHRVSLVAKIELDDVAAGLARLRRLLVSRGLLTMRVREVYQALKGAGSRVRTMNDVERLVREAVKLKWVQRVRAEAATIAVNPALLTATSEPLPENDGGEG
jgi:hypothetical protein